MSTVIKASGATRAADRGSFNFDDMTGRANDYLDSVRRQADEILAQANKQAELIARQAQEQGRAAALAAAERVLVEKVGAQLTTLMPALNRAVERLDAERAQWLAHWE